MALIGSKFMRFEDAYLAKPLFVDPGCVEVIEPREYVTSDGRPTCDILTWGSSCSVIGSASDVAERIDAAMRCRDG